MMNDALSVSTRRPTPARWIGFLVVLSLFANFPNAFAQKRYGPGVTDSEIKLGQVMPYSGPASAFGTIGRAETAYFEKINDEGGVNGRKIKLISLDGGFDAAKTVEQTRRMVEDDGVLALFNSLGPAQQAVKKYVHTNKVPHLFVGSGAKEWDEPAQFPWSMGWQPAFEEEGRAFGRYLLRYHPKAKIAALGLKLDLTTDGLRGLQETIKGSGIEIVAMETHEITDPTADSQIISLKASGADVFINWSNPKTAAQVIRKMKDIGWQPVHLLSIVSSSIQAVLVPAGVENSIGIITTGFFKHPSDPTWKNDAGMKDYFAWMHKYYPEGDPLDAYNTYGYLVAMTMVHVLRKCGDDLTRENVLRRAQNIQDLELPLLLPGIKANTSPTSYRAIKQLRLMKFDGTRWVPLD